MRVTVLFLLLLVGCLGTDERAAGPAPDVRPPTFVVMTNFSFEPQDLDIKRGQAVTWTNEDDVTHHVSAEDGSFDSGRLDPDERAVHTFDDEGRYPYRCLIHPAMVGTIHVA